MAFKPVNVLSQFWNWCIKNTIVVHVFPSQKETGWSGSSPVQPRDCLKLAVKLKKGTGFCSAWQVQEFFSLYILRTVPMGHLKIGKKNDNDNDSYSSHFLTVPAQFLLIFLIITITDRVNLSEIERVDECKVTALWMRCNSLDLNIFP